MARRRRQPSAAGAPKGGIMKRFGMLVHALALCALAMPMQAIAQTWPVKPVRIIVPYPAGGTSDILARTLGQKLSEIWAQSIIVDNKPGANGNVGADFVAKAAPDGYTLLLCDVGALAISPSVYTSLGFDPNKDFAPVTMVAYSPHILAVNPDLPVKSVRELIDLAKATPGKLNYAASSVASAPHLAGVDFATRAGITWAYIRCKGGAQAITDVIGVHGYSPLDGSLNPTLMPPLAPGIAQRHFVGGRDRNVPPSIVYSFARRHAAARVVEVAEFDHECCWIERWPSLLE